MTTSRLVGESANSIAQPGRLALPLFRVNTRFKKGIDQVVEISARLILGGLESGIVFTAHRGVETYRGEIDAAKKSCKAIQGPSSGQVPRVATCKRAIELTQLSSMVLSAIHLASTRNLAPTYHPAPLIYPAPGRHPPSSSHPSSSCPPSSSRHPAPVYYLAPARYRCAWASPSLPS